MEITGKQAYELKWFCQNVVGVREDFYKVSDSVDAFHQRLKRLERTCELIEKYFGEKITAFEHSWPDIKNETPPKESANE